MVSSPGIVLFVLLSAGAVAASLHAFRTRQVYGYYRFFGFEALALLTAWNAGRWFHDPLSFQQVVSWIILLGSTVLAAHGGHLLSAKGKAQKRVIEDTQNVVAAGVYRWIRHPLYLSLILGGWGIFFKGIDLPSSALSLIATIFFIATARFEERFNLERFGEVYSEYLKNTKMFIPFVL